MRPVTINPKNIEASLVELQRASQENDIVDIGKCFTVVGSFTPTYTLNVAAPTTANVAAVLATLIDTLQKGGINRTT